MGFGHGVCSPTASSLAEESEEVFGNPFQSHSEQRMIECYDV